MPSVSSHLVLTEDIYPISNSRSETLVTFHFSETMQHNFVLEFHTTNKAPTPHRTKTIPCIKNASRTTISTIIRGYGTPKTNSSTRQRGQTHVTNNSATH